MARLLSRRSGSGIPHTLNEAAMRVVAAQVLRRLARVWAIPAIGSIGVLVNRRLRKTTARYVRSQRRIELSPRAVSEDALTGALSHEAAHAAALIRYGGRVRPHGPEWQKLVARAQAAGLSGRTDSSAHSFQGSGRQSLPARERQAPVPYEHRCPVCQISRLARRPVPRWRCAACVSAGLDGRLTITPRPSRSSSGGR